MDEWSTLEQIIIGASAAGFLGLMAFAINAAFMMRYASNYNYEKRKEFLIKEFGEEGYNKLEIKETKYSSKKRICLTEIQFNNQHYLLETQHKKSFWLADIFKDTRLYEPLRLVK